MLKFNNDHFSGPYGEDVVFVCNDWHTALLPCYLKSLYQPHGIYTNAKIAFCIYDIISQGRFAIDDFAILNLPDSFRPFEFNDGYDKSPKGNKMNWMKAGVEECDLLLTVSPYYAEELCSVDECAFQLRQFIKSKKPTIKGIANGLDVRKWNPCTDEFINTKYDSSNVHEGKSLNKEVLQIATGLPVDRNIPMIVFIGRLQEKDGLDILASALPHLMQENIQFLILERMQYTEEIFMLIM